MSKKTKGKGKTDPMLDTSPEAKERASNRRLALLLDRYANLDEEKKGISDDMKDVVAEAKAVGYDGKMFREMYRLRKMNPDDRAEYEALRDLYKDELGL